MISDLALAETGPHTHQQAEDGHAKFNNYVPNVIARTCLASKDPPLPGTSLGQNGVASPLPNFVISSTRRCSAFADE